MSRTADFWVGDRIVRPGVGEIRLGMERVHLEPRSMQVLLALAEKAPEVVPKKDLIDAVWGEKFVSDEVLTHAIWDLRRAFGDQASNPEFIQTIPKRGYRLIAPVRDLEAVEEEERAPDRAGLPGRRVALGIAGIALLALVSAWIGRWGSVDGPAGLAGPSPAPSPERASLSGRRPEPTVLEVTLAPARRSGAGAPESLEELRAALAALPTGIEVTKAEACPRPPGEVNEYCLTPRLAEREGGYRASMEIEETASSRLAYAASVDLADPSQLQAAGARLAELASTYFEIVRTWDVKDPDIRPWISFRRHDVRAIRDFLHGRALVLSHEVGAREPFETAIEVDPDFVAPRVWRVPTLLAEGESDALTAHKELLRALYDEASPFEKTMISWAEALIEGEPSEQLRQLKIALDQLPENRPVRMLLGATTYAMGDPAEASRLFEPLLQERWCYPPLFPLAATAALEGGNLEEADRLLALSFRCEPVDPESLGLLRLLAVYEGDAEAETALAARLERRTLEMLPEIVTLDLSSPANLLAERAEAEGEIEIAARLREFAD